MVEAVTRFRLPPMHEQRGKTASFTLCTLISSLCFIMTIAEVASGATYYLDAVNGHDDTGDGSSGNPWKTMAQAESSVGNGDTVYLRTGNYGEVVINSSGLTRTSWNEGVTYTADSGASPMFHNLTITGHENRYLTFQNITMTAPDDSSYAAMVFIKYSSYIRVINCTLTGRWSPPNDTTDYAIEINGDNYEVEGILVDGCDMSQVGRGIVFKYDIGHDVVIRNSIIHKTHGSFVDIQADTDSYIVIEYNHMYGRDKAGTTYHGSGVGPTSAGQLTIRGNIIHDYGSSGGIMFYPPGPVGGFKNILIENNLIYDSGDTSQNYLDMLAENITVRNNTIIGYNNGHYPGHPMTNVDKYRTVLSFGAYSGTIDGLYIYNNIFVGTTSIPTTKITITNLQEDNNIFWSLHNGTDWISAPFGAHSVLICDNGGFNNGHDTNFFEGSGNFFVGGNNFDKYSYSRIFTITGTFVSGPDFSVGEQVQQTVPHATATGIVVSHASGSGTVVVSFNNGAAFQTAANGGGNLIGTQSGAGIQDITTVSDTSHKQNLDHAYMLTGKSDAIGFADSTHSPSTDIFGRTRDASPDAGCYEYHGPVLGSIGDKSVYVNESLNFTVSATDPDADPITYSAQNLPNGSTFANQTFRWTPTNDQVGTYRVTFVSSDGAEYDSETITITVKSLNQAPTANAGPDQTAIDSDGNGSQQVTLNGSGSTDSDGTIQSYVWSEGGTQIATGVKPTVTLSVGQHNITLTVTDNGGLTDTDTVVITVNESGTNQPPIANAGSDQTVTDSDGNGSERVTLNGSGSSDPGGAIQSYVWREGGSQIATGANPTVTLSVGQHTITLTVTDNGGLTNTDTVAVTINAVDATPPNVTNYSPTVDSIQVPLNNLITLHIVDAGKGVDANSVTIKVNSNAVYAGNTANYTSATGNCRRTGTKADYTFGYQPNEMFEFEQKITAAVNATDLGGNSMPEYTYSFWTEMRSFGKNKKASSGLDNLACGSPATTRDSTGNTYVVWHAGPTGSRDIYASRLTEGAASFDNSIQLTADSADQCNPAIAIDGSDYLYVVWQDNRRGNWDVYVSTSVDGVSWSAERLITDSNDNQINPAIAIDGSSPSRAYIVWQDDRGGNQDIYVASSSDGFATKAVAQITANASDQTDPAIAVDSANTVYVVWTDKRNGSNDIYGAASNSGPWTNVPIVNKAGNQSSPAIAAETAGSILHLLWVDDASGNSDIYHAATNGLPSTPVTGSSIIDDSSSRNQVEPVIAVTGSTGNNLEILACWQDRRNVAGASGDTDLYFAEVSSDGGTNVFVGDDSTNSNQSQPAIGVDVQGHPYLVWGDSRSANAQIYYAGSTYLDSEAVDSKLVAASAGATVGVNPASIDSMEDVSVTVPAGACPCDIQITISKIKNPQEFSVQCLAAYDFGPSGLQFNQPVTITIPYAISGTGTLTTPYWFNSLTGALSQQGITDIKDIVISPTLHALSFKTTHFTPFYVVEGTAGGTGGGGGGCSVSATGNGSIVEFLLPYMALAAAMMILRLHDAHQRKERRLTKSES